MNPLDTLTQEHEVILRVLSVLEEIANTARRTGRLARDDARDVLQFLQVFADHCHHGKEENVLFPMLAARGLPEHEGPLAVMRAEHDQGRAHVQAMADALDPAGEGEADALQRFTSEAGSFVALLRAHIDKEENVLYQIAGQMLNDADRAAVLEGYARTTCDAGHHEAMLAVAERLGQAYDVALPSLRRAVH